MVNSSSTLKHCEYDDNVLPLLMYYKKGVFVHMADGRRTEQKDESEENLRS